LERLTPHDITILFLSLAVLLGSARVFGEIARRLNQPTVLGELLAGIVLGPTVLGNALPEYFQLLFPQAGGLVPALDGLTTLAITLFLLVAGMEVNLSSVWRQGKAAIAVSASGIVFPFTVGLAAAWAAPQWLGREPDANTTVFALFFATAMSISALPVIARTLMDLNIYRSDLGMVVIAAAVFNDLTGWLIFALILGLMHPPTGDETGVGLTAAATLGLTVFVLTVGRWLVDRALPWVQAHTAWPGGVLSFALALGFLGAAFTEWIGVHAVFGAFLVGVAIGDSPHLREQTRSIITQFVSFIFAPLFFASIGLKLDFAAHFDLVLIVQVMVIACIGKVLGCRVGAAVGGIARREAWAIGFAMNARGAMEIILGLLALQSGLIRERMFVALVVMAMGTSMLSGPVMRKLLRLKKARGLSDYITSKGFINVLQARDRVAAIRELSQAAAAAAGLDSAAVETAVWERETQGSTGVGDRIAVPHAQMDALSAPVVAVGLTRDGVDFDAPDGADAQFIFLILTPTGDDGAQVRILAEIARTFGREEMRQSAIQVGSYTEFLALLRTDAGNPTWDHPTRDPSPVMDSPTMPRG